MIDWKAGTQFFNFSGPPGANATPGANALRGLAVSRVLGIPTADELWGHVDFDGNPLGSVEELGRGTNLGNLPWSQGTAYEFRFVFTPTSLDVFVDDQLELAVTGQFADGRLGFYNFSQGGVRYGAFTSVSVPEPSLALLIGAGLAHAARRRRRGPRSA